jgi:hypothetical protein
MLVDAGISRPGAGTLGRFAGNGMIAVLLFLIAKFGKAIANGLNTW